MSSSLSSKSNNEVRINFATPSDRFWQLLDMPFSTFTGLGIILVCVFINLANINVDKIVVALDIQVLAKLFFVGLGGIYGFIGVITDVRVRRLLFSFPVAWMGIIIAFYFTAVPFSISQTESAASAVAMCAILLLMCRALVQIGILPTLTAVFYGMSLFTIFSWIVYFAWPEVGVMMEALPEGAFARRMSGLSHPNTLGQYTGLTVVLGTIMYFTFNRRTPFVVGIIGIAALALVFSLSRTSLVATVLALAIGYRHIFFKREYWLAYGIGAFLMLLGLLILSTQVDLGAKIAEKLTIVSKSGDADELTSATGRSEIWSYAIYLLGSRPLTGFGAATSKFYLHDYSHYTHNLLLNVAFSTGFVGGLACLLMCLGRLKTLFTAQHVMADAIVVFILINGLFENVIFSIISGMPTMVWIIGLAWPVLSHDPVLVAYREKEGLPEPSEAGYDPRFLRFRGGN